VLELAARSEGCFTDAEVFQELLHRYLGQRRWQQVRMQVADLQALFEDRTEPIFWEDVALAGSLVDANPALTARDLLHLAVMRRVGARYIVTADHGFDGVTETERLDPARVEEWQGRVIAG
jgi:predicted nucleic acid-binding protein